jgi:hypothetical protein
MKKQIVICDVCQKEAAGTVKVWVRGGNAYAAPMYKGKFVQDVCAECSSLPEVLWNCCWWSNLARDIYEGSF